MDELGLLPERECAFLLWNSVPTIPLWFFALPISDSRINWGKDGMKLGLKYGVRGFTLKYNWSSYLEGLWLLRAGEGGVFGGGKMPLGVHVSWVVWPTKGEETRYNNNWIYVFSSIPAYLCWPRKAQQIILKLSDRYPIWRRFYLIDRLRFNQLNQGLWSSQ